jgi:hypothetical protein
LPTLNRFSAFPVFGFVNITANGLRLYACRVFVNLNYFFGSARAYHCEAKTALLKGGVICGFIF